MTVYVELIPFGGDLPFSIYPRISHMPVNAVYPKHKHNCGEFVYSYSGVMEVLLSQNQYIAPPQYGLWIPPNVEHIALNHYEVDHCSLYLNQDISQQLPNKTCALILSPLIRSLLDYINESPINLPITLGDERLLQVLVDQLKKAPRVDTYLPKSDDPDLASILMMLDEQPNDTYSLSDLAKMVNVSERTIMRRCKRDLGMTLSEWKQRSNIIKALSLLDNQNLTVESIAFDLGYSSSSAFIFLFKKLMGCTPSEFRKHKH